MSGFVLYDEEDGSYLGFEGVGDSRLDVCSISLKSDAVDATRISGKHKEAIEKFLLGQEVTLVVDEVAFCADISQAIKGMDHVHGLIWVKMKGNTPDKHHVTHVVRS